MRNILRHAPSIRGADEESVGSEHPANLYLGAKVGLSMGGGIGEVFLPLAEAATDWIVVDVIFVGEKVGTVAHAAVGESFLPDWEFGF